MGFLQNDTNNIILDAVLTDLGRQALANGTFNVVKFAVGDDEIDYSIISKFGRTVGKEKIEKNTPIFEALLTGNLAQKYKCVSVSNPNLIRLPNFTLTGEGVNSTNNIVSIGNTTVKRRTINVAQDITNEQTIDVELRDQSFVVEVSNLFVQIVGATPDNVDTQQRATYILPRDASETSLGGSKLTFTIGTKAISNNQFQIYGAPYNKNLISTFVKIYGVQSASTLEFEVQITKDQ